MDAYPNIYVICSLMVYMGLCSIPLFWSGLFLVSQPVSQMENKGDIGTKALPKKRLKALMCEVGMVYTETGETVGEADREELQNNTAMSKDVSKLAKTIMRMTVLLGLEPTGATAQFQEEQSCVACG